MKQLMHAMAAALALALAVLLASTPASAAIAGNGHVYMLNTGGGTMGATTDWRFYVETPTTLALDQDEWVFEVYGEKVNNTGSATTAAYTVTIYLDDGVINRSSASTITPAMSGARTYGNITFPASAIGLFEQNSSARMTVTLTQSGVKDTWSDEIRIYSSGVASSVGAWIPVIVSVMALSVCIVMISGFTDQIRGFAGRSSGKKRGKK